MINQHAFSRRRFASHVVGLLTYLVCDVPAAGEYVISVWNGKQLFSALRLQAREGDSNSQIDIDLAELQKTDTGAAKQNIAPKGKLVIYCSRGNREFRVTVAQKHKEGDKTIFDSERLGASDHFIFVPVLKGKYNFAMTSEKPSGTIVVAPSTDKKILTHHLEPKRATVAKTGIVPKKIEVVPGQPIVFDIQTTTGFEISM